MQNKYVILPLACGLFLSLFWQVSISAAMTVEEIDANRQTDWSQAGYPEEIPDIQSNVINVLDQGAAGDGVTDDYDMVQKQINTAEAPSVIYFPAGTYRFDSPLTLKSGIVLRGEGAEQTRLDFPAQGGCLIIKGNSTGEFVSIKSGLQKNSQQIEVADASGFKVGEGGQIRQEDSDAVDPTGKWAQMDWTPTHVMGQMVKITAVDGNTLTIEPPLNNDFSTDQDPQIRPVEYVRQVGVEDLHILREDSGDSASNITISCATDSWFRRIESEQTERYHFYVDRSLSLEIRDSYIHDSFSKAGGGNGYGTALNTHTTNVLVENNIFSDLRHAMIIQLGANGCVFGYNYAQRNYDDDLVSKAYISLHGHYPFMNLFEGNVVGFARLADYWGPCGPGNTLFRNRIMGTDRSQLFGPYQGLYIDEYSHEQNIIGNELVGSNTDIYFDGQTDASKATSENLRLDGNNVHGTVSWESEFSDQTLPDSFYLSGKPDFFGDLTWPAIGPDQVLGQNVIPAQSRFDKGQPVPQP